LTQIASEEERIGAALPECGKETQLRYAHILRFVNNREVEWRGSEGFQPAGELCEETRFGV
jgi:hypothetical protein